jgi:hypothetical protein
MKSIMHWARLTLFVAAWSCAEPTANLTRPAATTTGAQLRENNSYTVDAAARTVYVRLLRLRGEEGEPIHAFVRRMFESADSANAGKLVIDLRSVTGSDARLLTPLIRGIVTRDQFAKAGGLYLVVGPRSFSPAQNAAMLLQRYANPIFIR